MAAALAAIVIAAMVTYKVLWDRHDKDKDKKDPKFEEERDDPHRWN